MSKLGGSGPERPSIQARKLVRSRAPLAFVQASSFENWAVSGGPGAGNPGRGGSFRSLGEDRPPSRTGACGRTKLDGPLLRENSKFRIRSNGRAGQEAPANRRLCLALLPSPVCMSNPQTGPPRLGPVLLSWDWRFIKVLAGTVLARSGSPPHSGTGAGSVIGDFCQSDAPRRDRTRGSGNRDHGQGPVDRNRTEA